MLDKRIRSRVRAGLCALLAALPALACHSRRIPLYQDPMQHQRAERPPLALYEIDWWTPLVLPSGWEYLPREPAPPAADADGGRIIVLTRDKMARAVAMDGGRVEWSFATRGTFTGWSGPSPPGVRSPPLR